MPRYINKPNITINKFYGNSKKDMLNNNSFLDDFEDFETEYEDFDNVSLEQQNPYKRYSANHVSMPEPLNHTVYHHHTHEVIFNNNSPVEETVEDYDFFDENEYVLEELPPVQQPQRKYVLKRYNQYNR